MKYCKVCKTLHHADAAVCSLCGKKLFPITDVNEPVMLCVIGGTERALLCGLLDDAEIPHVESNYLQQGVANELVTGYDVKLNNIAVCVPFQALPLASDLLSTIETVENRIEPMTEEIISHINWLKEHPEERTGMSRSKRTTIKVLTALAFLLLVAAVVLGTDALTGWIKGLFGG